MTIPIFYLFHFFPLESIRYSYNFTAVSLTIYFLNLINFLLKYTFFFVVQYNFTTIKTFCSDRICCSKIFLLDYFFIALNAKYSLKI